MMLLIIGYLPDSLTIRESSVVQANVIYVTCSSCGCRACMNHVLCMCRGSCGCHCLGVAFVTNHCLVLMTAMEKLLPLCLMVTTVMLVHALSRPMSGIEECLPRTSVIIFRFEGFLIGLGTFRSLEFFFKVWEFFQVGSLFLGLEAEGQQVWSREGIGKVGRGHTIPPRTGRQGTLVLNRCCPYRLDASVPV